MALKSSQVVFESGICINCPVIVQAFFDKNFTAVIHAAINNTVDSNKNRSFVLYRFDLSDGLSYASSPKISMTEIKGDYVSSDLQLTKSLGPEHVKLILSSKPNHVWSLDKDVSLMGLISLEPVTSTINFVICRVDADFQCEKIRSILIKQERVDLKFDKIKANKTHLLVTFEHHALSYPFDEELANQTLIYDKEISKVTFYNSRWYGICNNSVLCLLKEDGKTLKYEMQYNAAAEKADHKQLFNYTQLFNSGSYLVARYESEDKAGFHVFNREDKNFFTNEQKQGDIQDEDTSNPNLIIFHNVMEKQNMPKRYYEFKGRFLFATDYDLSMIILPPTLGQPEGKYIANHLSSNLNRTDSLSGDKILISLPLKDNQDTFALITEFNSKQSHIHGNKKVVINEVTLSQAYIDFNKYAEEDLMQAKNFKFDAYYYEHPNFKRVSYVIEFTEEKYRPQKWLMYILGTAIFFVFILFIIMCLKFKKALNTSKRDSFKPEDCSLMEPIVSPVVPARNEKLLEYSRE